ncbi:alpha/beta-glucosidase agdC [Penicillium canariense]|uniref:Probable alpha/beta-glucosidase agdC n=1 Tax=Penicillium canariense TaxID=189055 RepID=A0A9W9LNX6_9EURO|nr:alpha/beta-glucosidase agdC [Penicillium canariense]KAJ5167440.1 alpha/beta-glucosidase agdC [Penicillium canariense]
MRGSLLLFAPFVGAAVLGPRAGSPDDCPSYKAVNINEQGQSLTADLTLAGDPCNCYGTDLENLKLLVEYQTDDRLHVVIYDAEEDVYQVPTSVLPRPQAHGDHHKKQPAIRFDYQPEPFSFRVLRDQEVLFDTSDTSLIFQNQYLKLRTWLPADPHLYGLGEHSDSLRLPTKNYTRTLWSRDAYSIPENTNLYGNHPVYVDHRGDAGTHGVFFLNSNGMDIKIDQTDDGRQYLEYNTIGGVLDFYFLAGPTPKDVAKQYSEIVGLPAMQSYWTFGFHNCRYGYRDVYDVAEAVYNYSLARIPLETMWTDIDYMYGRRVFTLDPQRFPIDKMRELVDHLHKHNQHYIVMVDPAVSDSDNGAANRGKEAGVFLTRGDDLYQGAVWPGVTVYPDWFHPGTQDWWNDEFSRFFSADGGVDIDGLWIDMNEAANFCPWPCEDPAAYAKDNDLPPAAPAVRDSSPRPLPGFPSDFQPKTSPAAKRSDTVKARRGKGSKAGLPDRNLLSPPYQIANAAGSLSNKTIDTDLVHAGDDSYVEYDTHNLYGTMMSSASREAMIQRRPKVRPLVITRSTFAGAGAHVGHWLGDNLSQWDKYRTSIAQMLAFASIFQIPMVGSDVCGFGGNTTEELCARWATLGAFYPFYRNHNEISSIPQEFYRWPTVADAARKIIEIRYRLLDYLYTAFHQQTQTGEPFLQPLFYVYPSDANTFANEAQFFYGDALLISPVQDVGQTSVDAYFPNDIFYDWHSGATVRGHGAPVHLSNIGITEIPIHIRGGSVIPLRATSAMTTTELRRRGFEILVAPNLSDYASGSLYLDDGESLQTDRSSQIEFEYRRGHLTIRGQFGYSANVVIESVTVLGQNRPPKQKRGVEFDAARHSVTKKVNIALSGPAEVDI